MEGAQLCLFVVGISSFLELGNSCQGLQFKDSLWGTVFLKENGRLASVNAPDMDIFPTLEEEAEIEACRQNRFKEGGKSGNGEKFKLPDVTFPEAGEGKYEEFLSELAQQEYGGLKFSSLPSEIRMFIRQNLSVNEEVSGRFIRRHMFNKSLMSPNGTEFQELLRKELNYSFVNDKGILWIEPEAIMTKLKVCFWMGISDINEDSGYFGDFKAEGNGLDPVLLKTNKTSLNYKYASMTCRTRDDKMFVIMSFYRESITFAAVKTLAINWVHDTANRCFWAMEQKPHLIEYFEDDKVKDAVTNMRDKCDLKVCVHGRKCEHNRRKRETTRQICNGIDDLFSPVWGCHYAHQLKCECENITNVTTVTIRVKKVDVVTTMNKKAIFKEVGVWNKQTEEKFNKRTMTLGELDNMKNYFRDLHLVRVWEQLKIKLDKDQQEALSTVRYTRGDKKKDAGKSFFKSSKSFNTKDPEQIVQECIEIGKKTGDEI